VLYALIPVIGLLAAATIALSLLERRGFIRTERLDDRVAYLTHRWWRFTGGSHIIDDEFMLKQEIPLRKPRRGFRLVLTGESFMMGSPYVVQFHTHRGRGGIPDWLAAELPLRYPSRRFEVINAAVGMQNSFRVRALVEQILAVKPDLLIAAVGNNEGYVPQTALNEPLHQWIVYRALKRALLPEPAPPERPLFAPQDADSRRIETAYRDNMRGIVAACRRAGVRLMLATLPINWVYPDGDPRVHGSSGDPDTDPHLAAGRELLAAGRVQEAMASLAKSPLQGYAALELARYFERQGDLASARSYYRIHAQFTPNNRTRPSYNEFVRNLAREEGLLLADLEARTEQLAGDAIVPPLFYFDYCHLRKPGYYLMAQEILKVLIENHVIPGKPGEPRPAPSRQDLIARDPALDG
jgi:hypothetical protein